MLIFISEHDILKDPSSRPENIDELFDVNTQILILVRIRHLSEGEARSAKHRTATATQSEIKSDKKAILNWTE